MNKYPLIITFTLLYVCFLLPQLKAVELCSSFSCNRHRHDPIMFPFRVPDNQSTRCGYPGFELSCNNSNDQTLLSLSSEPLVVEAISYMLKLIWLSDPNHCIPKRVMDLRLQPTPYSFGPRASPYTFLNCSKTNNDVTVVTDLPKGSSVISCMSDGNDTVVVATVNERAEEEMVGKRGCKVMKRLNAAFWWRGMEYGYDDEEEVNMSDDMLVELSWGVPDCGDCYGRGGSCGLVGDSGLEVGCLLPDSSDFPKGAKYGLILGAGIPALLCIVGLIFYISSRIRIARNRYHQHTNTGSSPSIFPQPIVRTLGLDEPTIESYPKTVIGESKRLPKPSDNTCPICLSEYQPKESLRTIPECKHYFHADCIDEWLQMNATCPLCRNSPERSTTLPN